MEPFTFFKSPIKATRGEFRNQVIIMDMGCECSFIRKFLTQYKGVMFNLDDTKEVYSDKYKDISIRTLREELGAQYEDAYLLNAVAKDFEPMLRTPKLDLLHIGEIMLKLDKCEALRLVVNQETMDNLKNEEKFSTIFRPNAFNSSDMCLYTTRSETYDRSSIALPFCELYVSRFLHPSDIAVGFLTRCGSYQIRTSVKDCSGKHKVTKGITIDLNVDRIIRISRPVSEKENIIQIPKFE